MTSGSLYQEFTARYGIGLNPNWLSPQRHAELQALDRARQKARKRKQDWGVAWIGSAICASLFLLLAAGGFAFFAVMALAAIGPAVWAYRTWQGASDEAARLDAQMQPFLERLFHDMNEVYEAKKLHGLL